MRRLPVPAFPTPVRYAGVAVVVVVIAYFSFTGTVRPPDAGPWWDKQLHFAAYAALGLAIAYATIDERRLGVRFALVVGGAALYGAGIEVVQFFLPERYFGFGDMLANVVGALLASAWLFVERGIKYVPVGQR